MSARFLPALLVILGIGSVLRADTPEKDNGMVLIAAGTLKMGCADCGTTDTMPAHEVDLDAFWIDETPVTNAAFARFAKATGYKTIAERPLDPKDYPDVPKDKLVPGSAVFSPPKGETSLEDPYAWWRYVPGASWKKPDGPKGAGLEKRNDHPVVHIAYADAEAFCKWSGKRLPTEAEFELAARGGLVGKKYSWGDELKPRGKWPANIWQGRFPNKNLNQDGYTRTSPVKAFPANGFGLYDVSGNVWQWCSDWYRPDTYATQAASAQRPKNPTGPTSSLDPNEPGVAKRVQRGGSFLCSELYCTRYLVGSRGKGAIDSGSSNVGFRCARDSKPPRPAP